MKLSFSHVTGVRFHQAVTKVDIFLLQMHLFRQRQFSSDKDKQVLIYLFYG